MGRRGPYVSTRVTTSTIEVTIRIRAATKAARLVACSRELKTPRCTAKNGVLITCIKDPKQKGPLLGGLA